MNPVVTKEKPKRTRRTKSVDNESATSVVAVEGLTAVEDEEAALPSDIPPQVELASVAPVFEKFKTRPADLGDTRLIDSPDYLPKSTSIFSVSGTIAELNALVGVARALTNAQWANALPIIQQHLAEIERCLVQKFPPLWERAEDKILFVVKGAEELEKLFNRQFNRTDYFPLPGGHLVAAYLHLAAATCWRAERAATAILTKDDPNRAAFLTYLNRLQKVLILLARRANRTYGVRDTVADE